MIAKLLNNAISKYPYQWSDFMADNNNSQGLNPADLLTIFPQTDMAKQGFSLVEIAPVAQPAITWQQDVAEGTPTLVSGVWTQVWTVTTATAAEQASRTAAQWVAYQQQARVALAKTDTTVARVTEGIAVGTCAATNADVVTFMDYRRQLRAILTTAQPSTIPTTLPAIPAYPTGT